MPDKKIAQVLRDAYEGVSHADINSARELALYLSSRLGKKYYPSTAMHILRDIRNVGWYLLPQELGGEPRKATNFKGTIVSKELFKEAVLRTAQEGWE